MIACIKDLILRNIQAIEANFLMIDEEEEINLGLAKKRGTDENLETELKRRIEQEVIKRDYYMERISKFKEWTETVLVNIDSIMRTMGRDVFPDHVALGKQLDSERFGQPAIDSKRLPQHFRAESFNLGDSISGDAFGYGAKKRSSDMYSHKQEPNNTFKGHLGGQFKSTYTHEREFDMKGQRRGYSKGSQRQKAPNNDSFEI